MRHWKQILEIALREGSFEFSRSSGPGGQNVNKVESKAIWRWNLPGSFLLSDEEKIFAGERLYRHLTSKGDIVVGSERFRDREMNKKDCVAKAKSLFEKAFFTSPTRKKTKPTRASKRKRLDAKKHRGEIKKSRGRVRRDLGE